MNLIDVAGPGFARGLTHGEELRALIRDGLERWRQGLSDRHRMPPADYVRQFLTATGYRRLVNELTPDLSEEVRGIAVGANQDPADILAYNLMDEEWWFEPTAAELGCSVIATRVSAPDGSGDTTLLAQNMDLPLVMDGAQAVLRIRQPDAPEQIVLTAAGMIGLTGVNSAGLGICVNTLLALRRSTDGLPVAFVLREALRRTDVASAAEFLGSVVHASGQHYALADPVEVRGLECSAGACAQGPAGQFDLLHTNHPLWSDDRGPQDPPTPHWAARMQRSETRLQALADGIADVRRRSSAAELLGRTDVGLCVVPSADNPSTTFGSVEYLLTRPPTVRVALGRPDAAPWHAVGWSHAAGAECPP